MAEQNIAIIGRGLAGLTLAFRMIQAGYKPIVFGKSRGPANASRCAQGIVCNKGLIFAESPLFRAKLQTLKKLEAWLSLIESRSGQLIPRVWQGVDEPYANEEDFQKTVQRVYRGNFWGCYRAQNRNGYLHYPDDAWFDVDATMNALEKACEKAGVLFRDEDIEDLSELLPLFDHVTIAAGANSIRLLASLGIPTPKHFHVAGQSLVWNQAEEETRILVKGTLSLAVLPDRKILGSSSWKPEPGKDPDLSLDRRELLQKGQESFGFARPDEAGVISKWGTRIRFADRMPALGIWPDETLQQKVSILTGLYKNGLQLADFCAEQLLLELRGEPMNEFGEAFHIKRFFRDGRRASGSPPRACPLHPRTQSRY